MTNQLDELLALSIWRDGSIEPPERATVPVWDHAFLYGDGVFEGIRLRDGRLYRVDLHLARLARSSHLLGLELAYEPDQIVAAIGELAKANDLRDAHVRVVHSRGVGMPGIDPRRCPRSTMVIMAYPFPPLLGTDPVTLITSTIRRKAPHSVPAAAKSLNYLDSVLAKQQATAAGASDALMLDHDGRLAEATGANLFLIDDGRLRTPTTIAALPGITRRTIIELAGDMDIEVAEDRLVPADLALADEAFLTGTAAGIVPIGAVDAIAIANAPGPVTTAIDERYRATWTDPAYTTPIS